MLVWKKGNQRRSWAHPTLLKECLHLSLRGKRRIGPALGSLGVETHVDCFCLSFSQSLSPMTAITLFETVLNFLIAHAKFQFVVIVKLLLLHVHTHIYTYVSIFPSLDTSMYQYRCTDTHICMYIHHYVRVTQFMCMCTRLCTWPHIQVYLYMYVHIFMQHDIRSTAIP